MCFLRIKESLLRCFKVFEIAPIVAFPHPAKGVEVAESGEAAFAGKSLSLLKK